MPSEQELNVLKGKLNALSAILRLGHEAFEKDGLDNVALHVVNNSRMLVSYDRSCLLDLRGSKPVVLAVSGQPLARQDSEYCVAARALASAFGPLEASSRLDAQAFESGAAPAAALELFKTLRAANSGETLLAIPLRRPGKGAQGGLFLWLVEFFSGASQADESLLSLLAQHYGEALWLQASGSGGGVLRPLLLAKEFKPLRVLAVLGAAALLALALVRVRQSAVADFEIASDVNSVCYSSIDGVVKKVFRSKGDSVKKGERVLEFDADELSFKLASAQKNVELTSAELDLSRQKAFSSNEYLAKSKILAIKRDQETLDIERGRWLLSKCVFTAPQDGLLLIDDKEKLLGRTVRPGEKIFEIISPDSLVAEIRLSERDASLISDKMRVTLYLHTAPERPLAAQVVSVSPKPVLTEDRLFCYIVKVKIDDQPKGLICGMRGVARVGGEKVSLGYYLFRSAVLWWRKI